MKSVSLRLLFGAARVQAVAFPSDLAGYLVLEILDEIRTTPDEVIVPETRIQEDGRVSCARRTGSSMVGERTTFVLRQLLASLLHQASAASAGLLRVSASNSAGCAALSRELETALIPVNRSAGRRALARLVRDVLQAEAVKSIEESDWTPSRDVCSQDRLYAETPGLIDRGVATTSAPIGDSPLDPDPAVALSLSILYPSCGSNSTAPVDPQGGSTPAEHTLPLSVETNRLSSAGALLTQHELARLSLTPILSRTAPLPMVSAGAVEATPSEVVSSATQSWVGTCATVEPSGDGSTPACSVACQEQGSSVACTSESAFSEELVTPFARPLLNDANGVSGVQFEGTAALPLVRRRTPTTAPESSREWEQTRVDAIEIVSISDQDCTKDRDACGRRDLGTKQRGIDEADLLLALDVDARAELPCCNSTLPPHDDALEELGVCSSVGREGLPEVRIVETQGGPDSDFSAELEQLARETVGLLALGLGESDTGSGVVVKSASAAASDVNVSCDRLPALDVGPVNAVEAVAVEVEAVAVEVEAVAVEGSVERETEDDCFEWANDVGCAVELHEDASSAALRRFDWGLTVFEDSEAAHAFTVIPLGSYDLDFISEGNESPVSTSKTGQDDMPSTIADLPSPDQPGSQFEVPSARGGPEPTMPTLYRESMQPLSCYRTNVEELAERLGEQPCWREPELCRSLRALAGLELSPLPPEAMLHTPPPFAEMNVQPASDDEHRPFELVRLAKIGMCG